MYLGEFAESGALPQALNASVFAHQNNSTQTFTHSEICILIISGGQGYVQYVETTQCKHQA